MVDFKAKFRMPHQNNKLERLPEDQRYGSHQQVLNKDGKLYHEHRRSKTMRITVLLNIAVLRIRIRDPVLF
jgi:hypothetical protein